MKRKKKTLKKVLTLIEYRKLIDISLHSNTLRKQQQIKQG